MMRLIIAILALLFLASPVVAQFNFGSSPFTKTKKDYDAALDRQPTIDDIFPKTDFDTAFLPMVPLEGTHLAGISEPAAKLLGTNYFVAVNNGKRKTFAEIYKENRTLGRSNFVTVDSLVHPALAHHNAIVATIIEKRVRPQLLSLLKAIYQASVYDYQTTEDIPVKEDIDRNLAFLAVAIRLLEPDAKLDESDHVGALVKADLARIERETPDYSSVFKRRENFALYRPLGWYAVTPALKNYYRCRQWLGRTYLLLSDITDEAGLGTGNEFRRAVLLFGSLSRAKFGEATGMKAWTNLTNVISILEPAASTTADGVLSPKNFANVFSASESEFKTNLNALTNPIERARLFLTLKGKERPELNTKSVFELVKRTGKEHDRLSFRLFPSISQPETDWLASQTIQHKDAAEGFSNVPVGLFFLHARGFRYATNILADNTWRFDEPLAFALSNLTKIEGGTQQAEKRAPVRVPTQTTWQMFDGYVNSKSQGAQSFLRGPMWLDCCLESVIAGWVDGLTAIDRESLLPKSTQLQAGAAPKTQTGSEEKGKADVASSAPANKDKPDSIVNKTAIASLASRSADRSTEDQSTDRSGKQQSTDQSSKQQSTNQSGKQESTDQSGKQQNAVPTKVPLTHYLEPAPEVYRALVDFLENFETNLTQLGLFPEQFRGRNQDFIRLSKRFYEISTRELASKSLEPNDTSLLANIDQVYEKINFPVAGYIHFEYAQPGTRESGTATKSSGGNASVLLQSRRAANQAAPIPRKPAPNSLQAIDLQAANQSELMEGFELGKKHADQTAPNEGMNMLLGGPAVVDAILKTSHGATLARGGIFSFYEVPGPTLSEEHWMRKLDYGFVKPPFWCEPFQINAMGTK